MEREEIELGLYNYYGSVVAFEEDGEFFIELDNYDVPKTVKVSEEFYRAIEKEFKKT